MTTIFVKTSEDKARLYSLLENTERPYKVTVKKGGSRSLEQNAYLWGVVYATVLEEAGLRDQGWAPDDLHEYLLGECFGWQKLEGLTRPKMRPLQRSSSMTKMEFMDYIAFIQQWAAERGIYVPDPNEQ